MKHVQLTLLATLLAIGISVFITIGCQPEEPKEAEIFKVVEQMPRFPGCEDQGPEKEECAKTKMLQYIYENLKYPAIAKENGVEGMAVLQFVVTETGKVDDVKIVRDIGAGCGDAGKKVVEAMNNLPERWTPGKQSGRPVKVLYTLPIKFKLE
jgi:protein TonB